MDPKHLRKICGQVNALMNQYPEYYVYVPTVELLEKVISHLRQKYPVAIDTLSYVDVRTKRNRDLYSEEEIEKIGTSGILGKWERLLESNDMDPNNELVILYSCLREAIEETIEGEQEHKFPPGVRKHESFNQAVMMFIAINICETIGKELKVV